MVQCHPSRMLKKPIYFLPDCFQRPLLVSSCRSSLLQGNQHPKAFQQLTRLMDKKQEVGSNPVALHSFQSVPVLSRFKGQKACRSVWGEAQGLIVYPQWMASAASWDNHGQERLCIDEENPTQTPVNDAGLGTVYSFDCLLRPVHEASHSHFSLAVSLKSNLLQAVQLFGPSTQAPWHDYCCNIIAQNWVLEKHGNCQGHSSLFN